MSTLVFHECLKITDRRRKRGMLWTCSVCAAAVADDDLPLHREWHRKIDKADCRHVDSALIYGYFDEPQPFTMKNFLREWDIVCEDAYRHGQEPAVTLPVNVFPKITAVLNQLTGQPIPVTRVPMFFWPKVRAERGMVV